MTVRRDILDAFVNGIEISVSAIIFAYVGYKIGETIGSLLWRMVGVVAGAFGGYCFAVRNVLKTAPRPSPPAPDEKREP